MHVHAALLPPAEVADQVHEAVASVPIPHPTARGLFKRRQPASSTPQLDLIAHAHWVVPLTSFGFLSQDDQRRIASALEGVCEQLQPVTVSIGGGTALVDDEDRSVWVEITEQGEDRASAPGLRNLSNEVIGMAQQLGLFCDRRKFRTRIPIATVTQYTDLGYLEAVIAALDAMPARRWQVTSLALVGGSLSQIRGDRPIVLDLPLGVGHGVT